MANLSSGRLLMVDIMNLGHLVGQVPFRFSLFVVASLPGNSEGTFINVDFSGSRRGWVAVQAAVLTSVALHLDALVDEVTSDQTYHYSYNMPPGRFLYNLSFQSSGRMNFAGVCPFLWALG